MAVKPREKRDTEQALADRDERIEESKFEKNVSLHAWWDSVVADPRFAHIIRAVKRRKRLKGRIQPSAHAQYIADGYRMGHQDALDDLAGLAYTSITRPGREKGELTQTIDPDLNDGTGDEATRRFGG